MEVSTERDMDNRESLSSHSQQKVKTERANASLHKDHSFLQNITSL
jgi:hypothetical protein